MCVAVLRRLSEVHSLYKISRAHHYSLYNYGCQCGVAVDRERESERESVRRERRKKVAVQPQTKGWLLPLHFLGLRTLAREYLDASQSL